MGWAHVHVHAHVHAHVHVHVHVHVWCMQSWHSLCPLVLAGSTSVYAVLVYMQCKYGAMQWTGVRVCMPARTGRARTGRRRGHCESRPSLAPSLAPATGLACMHIAHGMHTTYTLHVHCMY